MTAAVSYNAEEHRDEVDAWCDGWRMQRFAPGWLPRTGVIVPGVACAWVYFTDSDLAIVENVISNPESTREARGEALASIQQTLESAARARGARYLLGQSGNSNLLERVLEYGYVVTGEIRQFVKVLQ